MNKYPIITGILVLQCSFVFNMDIVPTTEEPSYTYPVLKRAKEQQMWLKILHDLVIPNQAKELITHLAQETTPYPALIINSKEHKRLAQITAHSIIEKLKLPFVNLKPQHFGSEIQITEITTKINKWLETHKKIAIIFSNLSSITQNDLLQTHLFTNLVNTVSKSSIVIVCDQNPSQLPNAIKLQLIQHQPTYPTTVDIQENKLETILRPLYTAFKELNINAIGEQNGLLIKCGNDGGYYENCTKYNRGITVIDKSPQMYLKLAQFISQFKTSSIDTYLLKPEAIIMGYSNNQHYWAISKQECNHKYHSENVQKTTRNNFLDLVEVKQKIELYNQKKTLLNISSEVFEVIEAMRPEEYVSDGEEYEVVPEPIAKPESFASTPLESTRSSIQIPLSEQTPLKSPQANLKEHKKSKFSSLRNLFKKKED